MDKQKMSTVYEENVKAVYKYLFCLTHDKELTEDLTQETFYQAAKTIDSFRNECKISVWLCQIAKRLWYRELEKKKRQPLSIEEVEQELPSSINMEVNFMHRADLMNLFRLLHNLDETTREVMYLRLTGELSFAQIGSILGKTENWSRVTFYRGKQKIYNEMEKEK
jgi:RNA polymerase sigma-70 factor (ECF subfamily)